MVTLMVDRMVDRMVWMKADKKVHLLVVEKAVEMDSMWAA